MLTVNLVDVVLWTFRRNEKDVIKLYDSLSSIMQLATGGTMLNFGYWEGDVHSPVEAQSKLCSLVGNLADLSSSNTIIDVGSGYGTPALQWSEEFKPRNIICLNINSKQLVKGFKRRNQQTHISYINSTSLSLPFADRTVERIIALESAQHFKPLIQFVQESNRVLKQKGLLVMAIPVITNGSFLSLPLFAKLGILSVSWASEHYKVKSVISMVKSHGFEIKDIKYIGSSVYEPLARYYIDNREKLKNIIIAEYPKFLETILYRSILKMKAASNQGIIEYILLKAEKT